MKEAFLKASKFQKDEISFQDQGVQISQNIFFDIYSLFPTRHPRFREDTVGRKFFWKKSFA